jgi:polar amino acid transport system substrate-binding protein
VTGTRKLLALLMLATLGACGTVPDQNSTSSQPAAVQPVVKDDRLAAMVPAEISADGKLVFGQDQTNPPTEFVENGKAVGMDLDLGTAVAQKLGLQATFENAQFDGIIPALKAGRYEAAMSSFNINPERVKEVDMVSYFVAGMSGVVLKGNPDKLSLDGLCGKTVAVQKGTLEVDDLTGRSARCTAAGQPEIAIQQYQNQTDANLALTAKRVQAMFADSPVVDYLIKQTGDTLDHVGSVYNTAPYGLIVPKGKGDYAKAVQGALQALIDDGTYQKILDRWGVRGAIAKAEVNPAG